MKEFLIVVGGMLWVGAAFGFITAAGAMAEIAACIFGVSGSVLIAGGCILVRLERPLAVYTVVAVNATATNPPAQA